MDTLSSNISYNTMTIMPDPRYVDLKQAGDLPVESQKVVPVSLFLAKSYKVVPVICQVKKSDSPCHVSLRGLLDR